MLSILNERSVKQNDLKFIIEMIKKTGSLDYAQNMVTTLLKEAGESVKNLRESWIKDLLIGLADQKTHKWYW